MPSIFHKVHRNNFPSLAAGRIYCINNQYISFVSGVPFPFPPAQVVSQFFPSLPLSRAIPFLLLFLLQSLVRTNLLAKKRSRTEHTHTHTHQVSNEWESSFPLTESKGIRFTSVNEKESTGLFVAIVTARNRKGTYKNIYRPQVFNQNILIKLSLQMNDTYNVPFNTNNGGMQRLYCSSLYVYVATLVTNTYYLISSDSRI